MRLQEAFLLNDLLVEKLLQKCEYFAFLTAVSKNTRSKDFNKPLIGHCSDLIRYLLLKLS